MTDGDEANSAGDPLAERPSRPPSIGLGILSILLGIPFIAFDVAFARSAEVKSALVKVVMVVVFLFFIGVPTHFFFGHRLRWILPGLISVMGAVFTAYGVVDFSIGGLLLGVPLLLVGIAWKVPSTSSNTFLRWIAESKKYLTQNYSRKG